MLDRDWYIGAACDRAFVQHTAVMLTSLSANGDVPEAQIFIASFGLTFDDQELIRSHGGDLADRVTFVDIGSGELGAMLHRSWQHHYPPAVLGRLFLPNVIADKRARLLTLDSDMIVNTSVRPLFELTFDEGYIAAIHDTPRLDDPTYFNSGMMVIDVDAYNSYAIGERCLQWLSDREDVPHWPDQDALNTIVGHQWHRLDRRWNWAYCGSQFGDEPLSLSQYEAAGIAHFTGQSKPWSDVSHPGRSLYNRYLRKLMERRAQYKERRGFVDGTFLWTAAELFLGDVAASPKDVEACQADNDIDTLRRIVASDRFLHSIRSRPVDVRHDAASSPRLQRFALERLPISAASRQAVRQTTRPEMIRHIVIGDAVFQDRTGIANLMSLVPASS